MSKKIKAVAQPPDDFTGLKLTKPELDAAGIKGVAASLQQAAKYMSAVDILKTTLRRPFFNC